MPRRSPVLIVSDDPVLRHLLRDLLEGERVLAEEVKTPDEALVRCRDARPPALLLVDAIVDEHETQTFLSRLSFARPERPPPPVVLLTGAAPHRDLVAHELVQEAIGAPFEAPALLDAVLRHLGDRGASHTRLRAAAEDEASDEKIAGET